MADGGRPIILSKFPYGQNTVKYSNGFTGWMRWSFDEANAIVWLSVYHLPYYVVVIDRIIREMELLFMRYSHNHRYGIIAL